MNCNHESLLGGHRGYGNINGLHVLNLLKNKNKNKKAVLAVVDKLTKDHISLLPG